MYHIVFTVHDYLFHYWKRKAITRLWNISRCLVVADMPTYMLWLCSVNYIYLLTTYRGVNYWPGLVGQWGSWRHTSTCKWPIKTMRRLPEITVSSWKIIQIDHLGKYYCVLKWIIWEVINTSFHVNFNSNKNTLYDRDYFKFTIQGFLIRIATHPLPLQKKYQNPWPFILFVSITWRMDYNFKPSSIGQGFLGIALWTCLFIVPWKKFARSSVYTI